MLIIHPSDEMYGADRVVLATAAALVGDGQRVTVWLPDDERYVERPLSHALTDLGCTVRLLALPVLRRKELNRRGLTVLLRRLWVMRSLMRRDRPSAVLVSTSALLPAALTVPRSSRLSVHVHEVLNGTESAVLGALMARAATVICPSETARDALPERVRRKSVVVPNGTRDPGELRAADGAGLSLVVASRWASQKGHKLLLDAWAVLDRDDLRLVVLGGPPPTGTGVDVPAMVRELPNSHTVTVVGEVPDIGPHLREADIVVVPSTYPESFGLVAIEGQAHGCAVMTTDVGGCAEVVDDSCGWLLPPETATWSRALESLDRDEVRRKASAGRERFTSLYSEGVFQRRMLDTLGRGRG